jgi:D-aminoacyl-tRNA deacylase
LGSTMRLFVCSTEDVASVNIRDRLLEQGNFIVKGEFEGSLVKCLGNVAMVTIREKHLFSDNIDQDVSDKLGIKVDEVVFLSKHRSESAIPTLTVHPIGNYGNAEFGGKKGTLVRSAPHLMTSLLRGLKNNVGELPFQVSFETTHHGPYLKRPTLFIEIGSDKTNWENQAAAQVVAKTLLEVEVQECPSAIGIGGGHYAPRFTEVALLKKISFGHLFPNYAMEGMTEERFSETIVNAAKASSSTLAYVHKKSMPKAKANHIKEIAESCGLKVIESDDLEPL